MTDIPTDAELSDAWQQVSDIHSEYLERHGVKLPTKEHYKWVWLATLYHHIGNFVHKDLVSAATRRVFPSAGADQQVRHLKRDGWHLESDRRGGHKLDPYQPSPEFTNDRQRRKGQLDAADFGELKTVFSNKCATCGAREGRPDPRYGSDVVKLQKGHMDPEGPADDKANIIPQCQFCNRAYKNDFTFDEKGRARAIASPAPVKRASPKVRKDVRTWLANNPNK